MYKTVEEYGITSNKNITTQQVHLTKRKIY